MRKIFILVFIFICGGCISPQVDSLTKVAVDIEKAISYDLGKKSEFIVQLDTMSEAILANVNSIYFIQDTIVIFARNAVALFDFRGKYLCNLAVKGRGPDEFGDITHVFCKDGFIFITDMVNDCIRKYNTHGMLLDTFPLKEFDEKVIGAYPFPLGNLYVSRNQFRGVVDKTPELSLLDSNFNVLKVSDRLKMRSGLIYFNYFSQDGESQLLYTQLLNDTIYSIDTSLSVRPCYCFDFGKYKIPEEARRVYTDIYDLIEYTNTYSENIASLASHLYNTENSLSCLFASNGKLYVVVYNKIDQSSQVYHLYYEGNNFLFQSFQSRYKDYHVMAAIDSENPNQNFTLFFFKL